MSKKIFRQYILSIFAIPVALMTIFFLSWFICSRFVWQKNNQIYNLLKILQALSPIIIALFTICGFLFLSFHFLGKPLKYLDSVIDAAKFLSHPNEESISLPDELYDIENELNLAREQSLRNIAAAKEAEQKKNDLIVYLAHDLKTPLTSVIGYLTLLRDEPQISAELRAKYTGIALSKAERLEDLINDFFEITRFNLTTLTLESAQTNLSRMAEQITSEFTPILAEKNLTWRTSISPDISLFCDSYKLERVFDNLIRNAVNYSYPDSEILLTLDRREYGALLRVANRGKTIPPEKLARIFEQFFRLDSSRSSATGGSGLGLAISKEIIELHGGTITAHSENERITFEIFLPFSPVNPM